MTKESKKGIHSKPAEFWTNYGFLIVIAVLTFFIVYSPFLQQDLVTGSDSPFHLARIESLKEELRMGVFPVKLHSVLCYDYGYGVGFFYPNHLLYLPAALRLAGLSLEASFKIFAALLLAGIFASCFYSFRRIAEDNYIAMTGAVCVMFSSQLLLSVYHVFSMGTTMGFLFMPLAIVGMYVFATENQSPRMLGIGFTGLICTHMQSTLMALLVCLFILLFNIKQFWKDGRKVFRLAATVASVSFLTISYWLPMLEQLHAQTYKMSRPWTYVDDNVIRVWDLLSPDTLGWALVGWMLLVGLGIAGHGVGTEDKSGKALACFYAFSVVLFLLPACGIFWRTVGKVFNFLQFPIRLFVPATFLLVISVCLLLRQMIPSFDTSQNENKKKFFTGVVFLLCVYFGVGLLDKYKIETQDYDRSVIYEEIAGIGAGEEWLPVETTREMMTTPSTAYSDDGAAVEGLKENGEFLFKAQTGKTWYDIPFIWYRGYAAESEDGSRLKVDKAPETSMVRVFLPEGQDMEGRQIRVWFRGTAVLHFSYAVNAASVICLAAWAAAGHIRKKKAGRKAVGPGTGENG